MVERCDKCRTELDAGVFGDRDGATFVEERGQRRIDLCDGCIQELIGDG